LGLLASAYQYARRGLLKERQQIIKGDQRWSWQRMDHAAGSHEGLQWQMADRRALVAVVQGGVGMSANMRRERDLADIDRALRTDGGVPFPAVGRIAGKYRG